ncbi:MAG: hypothetical protein LIP77_10185, partial [Planctomycetes bacterium]|nr:hypothetical protein [Planctomycetota bacterium]
MMHAGNSPWWAVLALAAAVTVWPQPAAGGEATEAVHLTDTDSDEIAAPPAAAEQAEEAAEDEAEAHAAAGDSHGVATAGPESAEDATEEEKPAGIDLNRMLREVEALKRYADAEAEAALAELSRDRAHLTAAVADLRARRAALMAEVDSLQKRYSRQIRRLRQRDALEKEDSASRKALEGAARQAAATVRDRLTRSLYT